ncbi:hypothetical protein ACJDU8_22435 [Clostridium sp. WILCCON 0269]|uniref:Uncharacterized protein n=1 Tax=Candidatus Clostridium eludens TaxID=3381663 RepID=A0ABW8SR68_9CLOT
MKDLKYLINYTMEVVESLNREKRNGINKLVNKLNDCPEQWQRQTRKFIDVVRENIANRYDCIAELRELKSLTDNNFEEEASKLLSEITSKLTKLDEKDSIACDIYRAAMKEGL